MNGKAKKVTPIRRYRHGELIHETEAVKFGPVFGPNDCWLPWWERWAAGTNRLVPEMLRLIVRPGSGKIREANNE